MSTTSVPTPTSRCDFGIARCNITPPVGVYHRMWGAALQDQATGIHRPLTATAVAIQPLGNTDPGQRQIVIAIDHVLFRPLEMQEILEQTSQLTGVPEEQLLFAFSHTHAGGHFVRDRKNLPGGDLIGPYLDELPGKLAMVVLTAIATMQPAVMTYSTTTCPLGRHRDYWDEHTQQYVCGYNPDGETDQTLLVVRVTDCCERVVGTLVNYGCHPTTLAYENSLISPDYVGAMREVIELATNAPCAFLLSPCGDVGPLDGFTGDVRIADRNGRQLGYAVLSSLESMPPAGKDFHYQGPVISGATLGSWKHQPQSSARESLTKAYRFKPAPIDLEYLPGMPTLAEAERQFSELTAQEATALAAGDVQRLRDVRAMCERSRRLLDRLRPLPPHELYPFAVWIWRLGDAFWVAMEGEPYNVLQKWLRERFAGYPMIIMVMVNGARNSYMPAQSAYGKKLYQADIAFLAPGSLEKSADEIEKRLREWL